MTQSGQFDVGKWAITAPIIRSMAPRKRSQQAASTGPPDPDKLVRQEPGRYRSADGRFEVQESGTSWFLVDSAQQNEFGQDLIHGPFPSLKAVREQLSGARNTTPLPRSRAQPPAGGRAAKAQKGPPRPAPPPTWIDRLPKAEAAAVRRLVAALEREGIADAETVVRRDRESDQPQVALALIERRLDGLVAQLPEEERRPARELLSRAVELLTGAGGVARDPLPGWSLVELSASPGAEPANRRIRIVR